MYDYIIVGAGSAGCILANRLSEDPNNRVCLLEAGAEDKSMMINIPMGIAPLVAVNNKYNWFFNSEKEAGLNGREMYTPRGKVLGGSSSINAMIFIQGTAEDYNEWEALGNPGWGAKDIMPLYEEIKGLGDKFTEGDSKRGQLSLSDLRQKNPLSDIFIEAGREIGHTHNIDFNSGDQIGFGYYQVTQRNGQRCSSAKAFLHAVRDRPNLKVITGAHVTKILVKDKKAIGVAYEKSTATKELYANNEIILTAGSINSPQLLLLSGIGAKEHLLRHGVEIVHELPGVGENLQDHLNIDIVCQSKSKLSYNLSPTEIPKFLRAIFDYFISKKGMLTSNAAEAGGFIKSNEALNSADLQFHFIPSYMVDHGRKLKLGSYYTLHSCFLKPRSRGRVRLKSTDPTAKPEIQYNYLDHPDDIKAMISAFKEGRKILGAKVFKDHYKAEIIPGEKTQSNDEIESFIRTHAVTNYHPVGTCKMGADPLAVVDSELKVHGIKNLRIADASIMPTLISGNTNAPSILIGLKAAKLILMG